MLDIMRLNLREMRIDEGLWIKSLWEPGPMISAATICQDDDWVCVRPRELLGYSPFDSNDSDKWFSQDWRKHWDERKRQMEAQ